MVAARHAPLVLAAALLLLLLCVPGPVQARPGLDLPAQNPQTAPCYLAAMAALTKQGAIYSQGGALAADPINPSTGQPYPRTGPDSFDCSGLVWWAYAQAGVTIGTSTHTQINNGMAINCNLSHLNGENTSCWTLGDLVFLRYEGGQHVAIYMGNGLFMDCYNHAIDCILHDIATDSFYSAHFFQARRIVNGCEGLTHDPGTPVPSIPAEEIPDLEAIPALLAPVMLVLPWQCGSCDPVINVPSLIPLPEPEVSWYDAGSWFNWLGVQLWNRITLPLICWLFALVQAALNAISEVVNLFVDGMNYFWRLAVRFILWSREAFFALWDALVWFRGILWNIWSVLAGALALVSSLPIDLLWLLAQLFELFNLILYEVVQLILGIGQALSYFLSLFMALIPGLVTAVFNPGTAPQIAGLSDFFLLVWMREIVQAIVDSKLGWAWVAFVALFYVRFILWLIDESAQLNS